MDDTQRLEWGKREIALRMADIADMKDGKISLEEAQRRARRRSSASGMTQLQAFAAVSAGARMKRRSSPQPLTP